MSEIALHRINSFAHTSRQADVSPEDSILEIPLSEFQHLLKELAATYNQMAEIVQKSGILRGHQLAEMAEANSKAIKTEKSPVSKFLLINAYLRQLLKKIDDVLRTRPAPESGKIIQVLSKVMARAVQIIDEIKTYGENEGKRDISLDSQQARLLFKGAEKQKVSRRDTIRAMWKAKTLWPALECSHRPGDGRQTMRLTIERRDLPCSPEMSFSDHWQRSTWRIGIDPMGRSI